MSMFECQIGKADMYNLNDWRYFYVYIVLVFVTTIGIFYLPNGVISAGELGENCL